MAITQKISPWLIAASLFGAAGVQAQQGSNPQATAQQQQEQVQQVASAVVQRYQSFLIAFNGNGALPPDILDPQFLQQVSAAHLQQTLNGLKASVGPCQAVGRMQTTDAATVSFLLNCEKGYVPTNMTIEPRPPYRITGILIQPTFWK